jgi:hypothetical protein
VTCDWKVIWLCVLTVAIWFAYVDLRRAFGDLMRELNQYRETNDERVLKLERELDRARK